MKVKPVTEEIKHRMSMVIYDKCRDKMPESGKEWDVFIDNKLSLSEEDTKDVIESLYEDYRVPMRLWDGVSVFPSSPVFTQKWQQHRLLINRILAKVKGLNICKGGPLTHISDAMECKAIKELWENVYNSNGYEPHPSSFWCVFLAIHDYIQQHGGAGVWSGNLTMEKFGECIQYRCLFNDDKRYAYENELCSALFGWW